MRFFDILPGRSQPSQVKNAGGNLAHVDGNRRARSLLGRIGGVAREEAARLSPPQLGV
jgi:hypothetical protein